MAALTRHQLQEKITALLGLYPVKATAVTQLSAWLDTQALANVVFDQATMKARLLDDLDSYEWGED